MILFALLTGIYSYYLFFLGIVNSLSSENIIFASCLYLLSLLCLCFFFFKTHSDWFSHIASLFHEKMSFFLITLLSVMVIVNFLGSLAPELAFDALWYHLTLPKIYLLVHKIVFIPGSLFYYSAMPKLAEMLFVGSLAFGGEEVAKVLQMIMGVCTFFVIYKFSRLFVPKSFALLACVTFYANLVVAWESTTAYTDLFLTFFISCSMYLISYFLNERKKRFLYLASICIGLAITVKIIAIGFISVIFVAIVLRKKTARIFDYISPLLLSLIVPLPWFLFSMIHTGNPLYPFFTSIYPTSSEIISLKNFSESFSQFVFSADPISPLYLTSFPLVLAFWKLFSQKEKEVIILAATSLSVWFFTPKSGGGRFLMMYLPLFSVVIAIIASRLKQKTSFFSESIIAFACIIMIISIGYRSGAQFRYFPFYMGGERKEHFLARNLNFSFGDFYDTDGFFQNTIRDGDTVLLMGFHNLYYIDFPYIDQSFVEKGDTFSFIALQDTSLPQRFMQMKKIYDNPLTKVSVYGEKGKVWTY